jgi:hypothetical protein
MQVEEEIRSSPPNSLGAARILFARRCPGCLCCSCSRHCFARFRPHHAMRRPRQGADETACNFVALLKFLSCWRFALNRSSSVAAEGAHNRNSTRAPKTVKMTIVEYDERPRSTGFKNPSGLGRSSLNLEVVKSLSRDASSGIPRDHLKEFATGTGLRHPLRDRLL